MEIFAGEDEAIKIDEGGGLVCNKRFSEGLEDGWRDRSGF